MNLAPSVERDLIHRAQRGDDGAFERLVVEYTPPLFRVMTRMSSDPSEAEALVQEAFTRVWQALSDYETDRPFFPYLVTVATNLFRDQWRKSRRLDFSGLEPMAESLPAPTPNPETLVERGEILAALAEAVSNLPLAYRMVIALRYDSGMSYKQIAEILNLPLNTVRTHLHRAKQHLTQMMEAESHG